MAGKRIKIREPSVTEPHGFVERTWTVRRARLPQNQHERNWGRCEHSQRLILIHAHLSDEDFISTLIHEVAHACLPDLDESPILRLEWSVREALSRFGLLTEDD